MRADIHDGPEHMLQSETEYIDARPHQPAATKASCTARPDQQSGGVRRIAVLMGIAESDLDSSARVAAFEQGLEKLGWAPGRNVRIDYRWAAGDVERIEAAVPDLLSTVPDVIVADGTPALRVFHRATAGVPIVFTVVSDPVAAGFVETSTIPEAI